MSLCTDRTCFASTCSCIQQASRRSPTSVRPVGVREAASLQTQRCTLANSSPQTGTVGETRLKDGAHPGTYWSAEAFEPDGSSTSVCFETGQGTVETTVEAGGNLLRCAEKCNATKPNPDYCFEGSCELCVMEVQQGAQEVTWRANPGRLQVVRACICPVPRHKGQLRVLVLSDDKIWQDLVL